MLSDKSHTLDIKRLFYNHYYQHLLIMLFIYINRGRYCISGNRHQLTRSSRLGHDAVMFWSSLYASTRKTRKI